LTIVFMAKQVVAHDYCFNKQPTLGALQTRVRRGKTKEANMAMTAKVSSGLSTARSTGRALRFLGALVATVGLVVGVAGPAHGTNILVNGGFENGDFTGWVQLGNTLDSDVICPGPVDPRVDEGNCSAELGPVGSDGVLAQGVNLSVGTSYLFTFAFLPDPVGAPSAPSDFSACFGVLTCDFGATPVLQLTNPAVGPYHTYSFVEEATAPMETVSFSFQDNGPLTTNFLHLDAVSLSVPEPASIGLLGIGLAALFMGVRRKAP
jgi:hypothetical protein